MATDLALLSLNHPKLPQSSQNHQNPPTSSSWMWNPNNPSTQEDDDSWEVKAFEEDTGNIMGTTWPPRSYTCTFCRREFRSAQALGGHMNVHRRDRARLHQNVLQSPPPPLPPGAISSSNSPTFLIPTQEFSTNGGGLCLLYQLSNPNPTPINHSPSTLLSISPYPHNNSSSNNDHVNNNYQLLYSSYFHNKPESAAAAATGINKSKSCKELENEEVDLELRLGHRSTSSSSSTS